MQQCYTIIYYFSLFDLHTNLLRAGAPSQVILGSVILTKNCLPESRRTLSRHASNGTIRAQLYFVPANKECFVSLLFKIRTTSEQKSQKLQCSPSDG